jgi:hypothetical protein
MTEPTHSGWVSLAADRRRPSARCTKCTRHVNLRDTVHFPFLDDARQVRCISAAIDGALWRSFCMPERRNGGGLTYPRKLNPRTMTKRIAVLPLLLLHLGWASAALALAAIRPSPSDSIDAAYRKLDAVMSILRNRRAATYAITTPNGIDESSFVKIGGIEQWVTIRGEDRHQGASQGVRADSASRSPLWTRPGLGPALTRCWGRFRRVRSRGSCA